MDQILLGLWPTIKRNARCKAVDIFGRVSGEDLAQCAALACWDGLQKGGARDIDAVIRYSMTKARWSMTDAFRRELAQAQWRLDDVLPSQWEEHYADAKLHESTEDSACRRQLLTRACDAADKLPLDQREVIRLIYVEDHDQAEAGKVLGVTQSRISQIHTKAIRALRSVLV